MEAHGRGAGLNHARGPAWLSPSGADRCPQRGHHLRVGVFESDRCRCWRFGRRGRQGPSTWARCSALAATSILTRPTELDDDRFVAEPRHLAGVRLSPPRAVDRHKFMAEQERCLAPDTTRFGRNALDPVGCEVDGGRGGQVQPSSLRTAGCTSSTTSSHALQDRRI